MENSQSAAAVQHVLAPLHDYTHSASGHHPLSSQSTKVVASVSVVICPHDGRCSYWAKLVRNGALLPLPSNIDGAKDISGPYLKRGDEEMFFGDVLFEGEANHHRHKRGWTYWIRYVDEEGRLITYQSGFGEQKAEAKSLGISSDLLPGSGDLAGAVRVAHVLRANLKLAGAI